MKEKLTHNLNLKIFAVLFAIGIWLIAININDPYQRKTYTVTVQMLNMNTMTGSGKYVEVLDDSDEITVTVRDSRSRMDNFSASNIVATADLKNMTEDNLVPIHLTSNKSIENLSSEQTHVAVKVENIRRVQKKIEIQTKNEPEEGYILGKTSTEQNALGITGPESLIGNVAKATVTFDITGAMDDVSMTLPIELYDAEGNRINDSRIATSISQVKGTASILKTKEIPVVFIPYGRPSQGYMLTGEVESTPSTIRIAGKASAIDELLQLEIGDAVDVSTASETVVVGVDLERYLPQDVSLADPDFNGRVLVTAYIEPQIERNLKVKGGRIQVVNVPEGFTGTIAEEDIEVTIPVRGLESVVSGMEESSITVYADIADMMAREGLGELRPGSYTARLQADLPDRTIISEEVEIEISVSRAD
ncbi:MAG: hypothetical protein IJC59_03200 [Lachnospiraceae bacterium]|nr:hypothetical protein [Lachnospiraceae bacterium]